MALAETAQLIVEMDLRGDLSRKLGAVQRNLGGFNKNVGSATRATRGLGVAGTAAGVAIGTLGAQLIGASVRGAVGFAKAGIASLNELENVTVATNTVIESTQGVAGQTEKSIRNLAEEYENLNATMDDKVIQAGENMLLTFTNIREDAFEPALQAALDMNEAMGGGPEGLQNTIIQIGKALNDPVKGVTALRKVGVSLTEQQRDQIKTLVEQNDLYGAQRIILDELGTEFGGRFANAGQTAEGRMAKLSDTIEDLQKRFAGPLIPAIDRVRDKLIAFLGTDRVAQVAERLGSAIAGLFSNENLDRGSSLLGDLLDKLNNTDFKGNFSNISGSIGTIASAVAGLPWQAIGDAAKLLGTGSKALLDAFLGLPPWVQTAVLTGWGLNKLTGGALGSIVGELSKGLIKGVLNMNAAVVNVNGKVVNGPGNGPTSGSGGKNFITGLLATLGIGAAIEGGFSKLNTQEETITVGLRDGDISKIAEAVDFSPGALIGRATQDLLTALGVIPPTIEAGDKTQTQALEEGNRYASTLNRNTLTVAEKAHQDRVEGKRYAAQLNSIVATQQNQRTQSTRLAEGNRYVQNLNNSTIAAGNKTASHLDTVRSRVETGNVRLSQIAAKRTTFTVNNNVNVAVSTSVLAQGIYQQQITQHAGTQDSHITVI